MLELRANWERLKRSGYSASGLQIKNAGKKGLGVFALRDFSKDEVIEYCHCVKLDIPAKYVCDMGIKKYAYWDTSVHDSGRHGPAGVIVMGCGSAYNSADSEEGRNCENYVSAESSLVVFVATKKIRKGSEILTWWGQKYYDAWCRD